MVNALVNEAESYFPRYIMEKRDTLRKRKSISVQLTIGEASLSGRSLDICPYGLKVRLNVSVALCRNAAIRLTLQDGERTYHSSGVVRWHAFDLVTKRGFLGIAFDRVDPEMCRDLLGLIPGQEACPYQCKYSDSDSFLREYTGNMCQGGLFLGNEQLVGLVPALHSKIHVCLRLPDKKAPLRLEGEVVAVMNGGVGLKLASLPSKPDVERWMRSA